ncbi:hypothetical protein DPPLL_20300 [Desulfofustis limnaeus]|uniref:Glucuronosyltransferase GumK N-terminal domain-containing protein n=1 Tax=Desulfofustis limnaeus TaxID=2740163 RepID=A0ABM7W9N3_9BACT|nr:glycosyltransferase [Desulfofustis limnaeus]BDD87665.1 hypothetical protein DPPLL_20300 [Desulfofustis limnaeus]
MLKFDERLNFKMLLSLSKGKTYELDGGKLLNITNPNFALPNILSKRVSQSFKIACQQSFVFNFKKFANKYFNETDFFIFESTESVLLFERIKEIFPKSKLIYRPSDPIVVDSWCDVGDYEEKLIKASDWTFLVNEQGLKSYEEKTNCFIGNEKYSILSNGVSYKEFQDKYETPYLLSGNCSALYLGARPVDWELIINSAQKAKNINFVIVCPEKPSKKYLLEVNKSKNIQYVPGIFPEEVARWITNCDVFIVPNPRDLYKQKVWGITAKLYQAMAARKPIVVYHDYEHLRDIGVKYSYDTDSFVKNIYESLSIKEIDYRFDFNTIEWKVITDRFYEKLEELNG